MLERAGKVGGLTDDQLQKVQKHMAEQVTKDRLKEYSDQAFEYGVNVVLGLY